MAKPLDKVAQKEWMITFALLVVAFGVWVAIVFLDLEPKQASPPPPVCTSFIKCGSGQLSYLRAFDPADPKTDTLEEIEALCQ